MISQNKNSSKKVYALYLAVAFFFTVFSFGKIASAAVLYDNSGTGDVISAPSSGYEYGPTMGPTYSYPFTNFYTATAAVSHFRFKPVSGVCSDFPAIRFGIIDDAGNNFAPSGNATAVGALCDFPVSIPMGTNIAEWYWYGNGAQSIDGNLSNGGHSFDGTGATISTGGGAFQLCDSGGCSGGFIPPTPPTTHIISLTPSDFSSTTSPFAFHFNFYNSSSNPVLNACVTLYDEAIGGPPGFKWREGCSMLSFLPDATIDFSQYFSAYPSGDWAMVAAIYDQDNSLIEATTTRFFVTSDSSGYQNYVPSQDYATTTGFTIPQFTDATVGTSTLLDTTNFLSFLNVPQLLKTKVPFSYIFQIGDAIDAGLSSSTALEIPSGTFEVELPLGTHGTTTLEVDMFSTTTITYFLNDTAISSLRGLMAAITYIGMGMFIFFDARSKKYLI